MVLVLFASQFLCLMAGQDSLLAGSVSHTASAIRADHKRVKFLTKPDAATSAGLSLMRI
jgi:hypothetical protein